MSEKPDFFRGLNLLRFIFTQRLWFAPAPNVKIHPIDKNDFAPHVRMIGATRKRKQENV
jgi:hypothetical protein